MITLEIIGSVHEAVSVARNLLVYTKTDIIAIIIHNPVIDGLELGKMAVFSYNKNTNDFVYDGISISKVDLYSEVYEDFYDYDINLVVV